MAIDPGRGSEMEWGPSWDEIEERGHRVHEGGGSSSSVLPSDSGTSRTDSGTGTPGPAKKPGLGKTAVAADIFADYSGPEIDAAKTLIKQEMVMLGWPQSIDANQMALYLLKNGLENQPQEAFESLWGSKFLTNDMKKASPWARFGQDVDTFHQNLTLTQDTFKKLTGMDVSLGDMTGAPTDQMSQLLQTAIKNGWAQGQIMDFLQAGSFTNIEGQKVDLTPITTAQPWLASGQGYQQEAQQFHNIYGAAPVNTEQLAGWFRFNQSAAQMGPWYARQAMTSQPANTPATRVEPEVR